MLTFTRNEIRDLIIAFIVISIAFAIANVGLDLHGFVSIFPIVMIGVGVGSLVHEIGHKYVAMKYGYQAEFKAWPLGLVIALATAFIGWVFAAPGEAHISADNISDEINGKISIAGPMTNIALALLFIGTAAIISPLKPHSDLIALYGRFLEMGF